MAKPEPIPSYPCMAPPPDARRVEHLHEVTNVRRPSRLRRLASMLRRVRPA